MLNLHHSPGSENRIKASCEVADYAENDPETHWTIPLWIKYVVRESQCGIAVTVAALILIEQYQEVLVGLGACEVYEVEGVCRLFLAAYMSAAKFIYDKQPSMSYWITVSRCKFRCAELIIMERKFLEVLGWRVAIDPAHHQSTFVGAIRDYDTLQTERLMADMKNPWIASSYLKKELVEEIPMLGREDEELFRQTLTLPEAW